MTRTLLIAIALLGTNLPDLLKYLVAALAAWIVSTLLVLTARPAIRR